MDIIIERCAGLDVGKKEVVACLRIPGQDGHRHQEVRTFSTFTGQLEALADWLGAEGVSQVSPGWASGPPSPSSPRSVWT